MPHVYTVVNIGTSSIGGIVGSSGEKGFNFHHDEDHILSCFLSWDVRARSCLGVIGMVSKCCVKPLIISGEKLPLNYCGSETYSLQKW